MVEGASSDPSEKLVMIVDDDDSVRELMEFVVRREGFRQASAKDGAEALRMIGAAAPHLVILDLMLPKYAGFEVLRQLQGGKTAAIPIIVVTGRYNDPSTREMIRQESNVADFLEKPVQPESLALRLHEILGTRPRNQAEAA